MVLSYFSTIRIWGNSLRESPHIPWISTNFCDVFNEFDWHKLVVIEVTPSSN